MITTLETFEINEANEDIYEFVSSLFSVEEKTLLNNELFPLIRLESLNKIKEKAFEEVFEEKEIYDEAVKTISRDYLIRIFQDFLNMDIYEFYASESLINNSLYLIQKQITYLDTIGNSISNKESLKELFQNEKEFNYTFLNSERDCNKKRNLIIKEAFNNNNQRYLNVFKEKLLSVSAGIYKQILFLELQKLSYDEIAQILTYLTNTSNSTYTDKNNNQSKNAELFLKSGYWGELLTKDQKAFYSSVQLIRNKLKKSNFSEELLTEQNKEIIETLLWLKSSPKESLQTLETLTELYEREDAFAFDRPSNLILHLYELKEKISIFAGKTKVQFYEKHTSNLVYSEEMTVAKVFCDGVVQKVCNLCQTVLSNEVSLIKSRIKAETNKKLKEITKKLFYVISVIIFLTILKFEYYYFFDIHNIYKNNYLKNAKLSMESTSYFIELKDSLDPATNETNQKLRLDYIKDLNSRYFKILTVFLNPSLSDEAIRNSLLLLTIPENIKNLSSIKTIRSSLSKIFYTNDWKANIEPMLGPNVLTELRAYGAICNFLIPSLSHYVIKDKSGGIKIFTSKSEKDLLSDEPKNYIDKYDTNYKTILQTTKTLLTKIAKKKTEVFIRYEKSSSKEEKSKLKIILQGIAIAEIRLRDLESKILARHDCIIKNNTYRAPY